MTQERWGEIQDLVKEKFEILEETTEPLMVKVGLDKTQEIGKKQIITFSGPLGKTKLEYTTKPVILEKKEHYTRRMGTSSSTEYIYSETEFTHHLDVYVWRPASPTSGDDNWEKADSSMFESEA